MSAEPSSRAVRIAEANTPMPPIDAREAVEVSPWVVIVARSTSSPCDLSSSATISD